MNEDMLAQMVDAGAYETRILAFMEKLEQDGIVRHTAHDEWEVLDKDRYYELTGIRVP